MSKLYKILMIISTVYLSKAITIIIKVVAIVVISDLSNYRNNTVCFISIMINNKIESVVDIRIVQGIEWFLLKINGNWLIKTKIIIMMLKLKLLSNKFNQK